MIRFLFCLSFTFLFYFQTTVVRAQTTFRTTSKSVIGYLEYLPDGYKSSSKDYPVVIFLHGRGEKGPNSTDPRVLESGRSKIEKLGPPKHVKEGTRFPFILISPQLKTGYGGWPTSYVMEVLEHVQKTLRIDKSRIYITGLSMGGFGTWAMIQQYPHLFAAAAPVCGGGNTNKAKLIAAENLPVWAFHGDADNVVNVRKSIDMVNAINSYNPNPKAKLSIYRGVKHDAWVRAYRPDHSYHNPNVYEWLMSYRKGSSSKPSNEEPVADAGSDKTIREGAGPVVIAGSGKDKDGSIKSYSWSKTSGGSVDMDDTNKKDLVISDYSKGTYVFRLTVTDDDGAKDSDDVKVTVEAGYAPPVANAGDDVSLQLPKNSVTLKGAASIKDGKIASVSWKQTAGGEVQMSGASTLDLKLEKLKEGEYKFRLTVKSDKDLSDSDEVMVTVKKPSNIEPVANAGSDLTARASDDKVVISGSAKDEDGTITKYSWKKVSGGSVDLDNDDEKDLTVSGFSEGTYVFRLTVTDNKGATDSDDVKLTVQAPAYKAPVANAGPDQEIELPKTSVILKGSGKSEDGKIASYAWSQLAGDRVDMSGAKTADLTVKSLKEGEYKFKLTVKSDKGLSDSDEVLVTVKKPSNIEPVANAGADVTIKESDEQEVITGSGKDEDGKIASYSWTKRSGGSVKMKNADTRELTISDFSEGVYVFRLTVVDDKGAKDSDDVQVSVEAPDYKAPVANAGRDQEIELPTSSITLKGSAKAEDGKIVSYAWTKRSGEAVELSGEKTPDLLVKKLKEGEYVFRLTVKTDKGLSDSDDVMVKVEKPANSKPVADAGSDITVSESDDEVVIEGAGSDKDGSITKYEWSKVSGGSVDMDNADTPNLIITDFAPGTYTFRLTVTDNKGSRDSDDVKVTVEEAEEAEEVEFEAPVADAGRDQTVQLPKATAVLKGSGKTEEGKITGYSWKKISGADVEMSGEGTETMKVSKLREGEYKFRLTVKADNGLSDSDDVVVTVIKADSNKPPVADAGNDRTISDDSESFVLIGFGEDDDGEIESYKWRQVSGENTVTISDANTPAATITDFKEGTFVFRLTVTDDDGAKNSDEVTVIVKRPGKPTAYAGNDRTIVLPENKVVLRGGASVDKGIIAGYKWAMRSGGRARLSGQNSQTLVAEQLEEGEYIFRLTATADNGLSDHDDIKITVRRPGNTAPVADAGPDHSIDETMDSFVIAGSARDDEGPVTSYSWQKISGGQVTLSNAKTPTLTISGFKAGKYVFRLTVTDELGEKGSDNVVVVVNPPARTPDSRPVAYAGNDRTIRLPINSVTIRGGAKAEGRTIVSYEWEQVAGGHSKLSGMDGQTMVAEDLEIGKYTFRLKATCDQGFSAYDDIHITVGESLFPGPVAERSDDVSNGRLDEGQVDIGGDLDKLASTDLTAGAVPDLENYDVAVYNDRGEKIFHGAWKDDSFDQVFQQPGFYVYHVLDGRTRLKTGKLVIQP